MHIEHCIKCGSLLTGKQKKYCAACEKLAAKDRATKYRENHRDELREVQKKWRADHPEQKRLISRNYFHRNPEKHKLSLMNWRKKNPDKVSAQNKRARKKIKRKEQKRSYMLTGKRKEIKRPMVCPTCDHKWKSNAKRPQCLCGHSFPRNYFYILMENGRVTFCKSCGREIPYQGRGMPRKYCECCLPQILALKSTLNQMRYKKEDPDKFKKWYRATKEIIVASTCSVCSAIIPYKGKGMVPYLCEICGPNRELNAGKRREAKRRESWMTIEEFIVREKLKNRLLYKGKKWTTIDIAKEFERWRGYDHPNPVSYEEMEYEE